MRIGRAVAASSITISLCGLVGQAAAFFTAFLLARIFGASADVDAFAATMAIPYFAVALIQASVNKAFVPIFVRERQAGRRREAWRLAGGAALVLALGLMVVAAAGVLFAPDLSRLVFPGFTDEVGEKAARLAAVTIPACLPLGLAAYLVALHMARRRFLRASLSQALQPIGGLVSLILLHDRIGILALPVGIVVGVTLQVVLLALPLLDRLRRHGVGGRRDAAVASVAALLPPLVLAAVFAKAFSLLEKRFGAILPEGSLSHMAYGWKLVAFLFFLISNGVILSSFTFISETAATGNRDELRRRTAAITRGLLLVLAPIVAATLVLRVEAMSLFERGAFTRDDSFQAALAGMMYLPLLVVYSLNGVASHVFYALGRVRTVVLVSAGSILLYVILGPMLARVFEMPGLLAAYATAVAAGYLAYLALLGPLIGGIEGRALLVTFLRAAVAAAVAAGLLELARRALRDHLLEAPVLLRATMLTVLGVIACLPYAGVVRALGDRELFGVLRSLRRRKEAPS